MSTRKRIPGCLPCQERHVKCDRGKPICNSCRNLKYPTVCEYALKRLQFRQSRYSSSSATTNMTRREVDSARTPSANDNDLGAASGSSDTTHAAPSTLHDYETRHHSSTMDGAGSARTLASGQSSVVSPVPSPEDTRRYSSSPLPVAGIALTPKPSIPSYCLFPLGISPVDTAPDGSGYGINGSTALVDLSHPRTSVEIEHVSPNTRSDQTSRASSRTLTEEIDCRVFAFYVERAGHWVCVAIQTSITPAKQPLYSPSDAI
jgi:hypothetical protein